MKSFTYFHCYSDELWEGYEKNGLLDVSFGIRLPQGAQIPNEKKFNEILKKGGFLHSYIKKHRCPLYIDRLQGGSYIQDYEYDQELIEEYKSLLGEDFLGFQIHEWLSNYHNDVQSKLGELESKDWNEESITAHIFKKFPFPYLFLEAMSAKEHAEAGKPADMRRFYKNMTAIYDKRAKKHPLVPCDSYFIMYPFEAEHGAEIIMPEVGAQIPDMRLQMCFARGVCKAYGIKLGAYYEPWGGIPFTTCSFQPDEKNEWYIGGKDDFPFVTGGPRGGSSRSLQWRVHLYAYLSGAEMISEEWGGFNTFKNTSTFELSEYGEVKKRFLDFVKKYPDIGEKVAPIAAVISNALPCYTLSKTPCNTNELFGYPLTEAEADINRAAHEGAEKLFKNATPMLGNEAHVLINSDTADAVDMLNEGDGKALDAYEYLVDLTGEKDFASKHANCVSADDVPVLLKKLLPCAVEGGLHYMLNKCRGGYYLSVFNHSGIVRTQKDGDTVLPEATQTAYITLKESFTLTPLEGNTDVTFENGKYRVTLSGGDWLFAKIQSACVII